MALGGRGVSMRWEKFFLGSERGCSVCVLVSVRGFGAVLCSVWCALLCCLA